MTTDLSGSLINSSLFFLIHEKFKWWNCWKWLTTTINQKKLHLNAMFDIKIQIKIYALFFQRDITEMWSGNKILSNLRYREFLMQLSRSTWFGRLFLLGIRFPHFAHHYIIGENNVHLNCKNVPIRWNSIFSRRCRFAQNVEIWSLYYATWNLDSNRPGT